MTLNLSDIIDIHSDMLRPCPNCGSCMLIAEETIVRITVFDCNTLNIQDLSSLQHFSHPNIHYRFKCSQCYTQIFGKTIAIKEEKNYFEVIARLFKDMEYAKTKARLGNTRQSTIKEVLKNENM